LNHSIGNLSFPQWEGFSFWWSYWKWLGWSLLAVEAEILREEITKKSLGEGSCELPDRRGKARGFSRAAGCMTKLTLRLPTGDSVKWGHE
jgi:hypothetical protein